MALEIGQLWRLVRRWWWLVALGMLIGGVAAYAVSSRQTTLYAATATLQVQPAQSSGVLDYSSLATIGVLAETYRQIVLTAPVLQPVIGRLGLPYGIDEFERRVTVSTVQGSLILKVAAEDSDPARAAEIANALATTFTTVIGRQNDERTGPYRAALQTQLSGLQRQIDDLGAQIQALEQGANAADPAIRTQIATLRATRDDLTATYNQLLATAQTLEANAAAARTTVQVVAPAALPREPSSPRVLFAVVLGVVAGGLLGAGAIVLLGVLANTTVRTETDLFDLAGGAVLAPVIRLPKRTGDGALFVLGQPASPAAEAIRLLRANVELAAGGGDTRFAISSPEAGDGRSVVTANLGVAMAEAGFATAIVDADLRQPSQHRLFGVPNRRGLLDLLTGGDEPWRSAAIDLALPNLVLVPSGVPPERAVGLIPSGRFERLLTEIGQTMDVILIDTPPLLDVGDALVVAARSGGVILVCRSGRTRVDALRRTLAALQLGGLRLVGVVLDHQVGRTTRSTGASRRGPTATGTAPDTAGAAARWPTSGRPSA